MAAPSVKQPDDIKKKGFLTKLKTKKKKFFVLRDEVDKSSPARLEYFQDEAKFLSAPGRPRRAILLRDCLDITDGTAAAGGGRGRLSGLASEVIHIYTKKDVFRIGCSTAAEKVEWLGLLQELKNKSQEDRTLTDLEKYEFTWEVRVMKKSSGSCRKIKPGKYRFCLTNWSIHLLGEGGQSQSFEFALDSIRRLGDMNDLFFMELGTSSSIGEGQLWIEVDDLFIARNIHMHVHSSMTRMNNCVGGRQRSKTFVESVNRNSITSNKSSKRASIQSTSSTSTSSTATVVGDVCDFINPCMSEGRTTSSSSVSSLRSSGSSLPSSVNKSSLSSVFRPGKLGPQGTPLKEGHYYPMDGFRHQNDLDFNDLLRTSSVGNKSEYLKSSQQGNHHQQQLFSQSSKDAERCSSAPHLKNEGEDGRPGEGAEEGVSERAPLNSITQGPLPYKKGCIYCDKLNSDSSHSDVYAPLYFEKPGKSRNSTVGICKRASCHFRNKVMTPKQPVGGKIFRTNTLYNYQHFYHHMMMEANEQEHPLKRERLPTIDGSMMGARPSDVRSCLPRPRASTGDQKGMAAHGRCCRTEALENGYMKMSGFTAGPGRRADDRSTGGGSGVEDDDPYLDMTEGLQRARLSPGHFSDYLDMTAGGSAQSPAIGPSSTPRAAAGDSGSEHYMDMSFDCPEASGARSSASSSSSSSFSSSSVSSVPVMAATSTISGNLVVPSVAAASATPGGDYMAMSFSPLDRLS